MDKSNKNLKLFPIYKSIAWDYIFYYTINFLFLTKIKGIEASNIVLITAVFSIFGIIAQLPASFIVEKIGRRNAIILGNLCSCGYFTLIILSGSLMDILFAEILSASAFALKGISEPGLLNSSIPASENKSKNYSRINEKGDSGYFIINAISIVLAGFLFEINGYIPISLTLTTVIIATIISIMFEEPVKEKIEHVEFKETLRGFKFVLKSKRLRALMMCAAAVSGMIAVLNNYQVNILDELNISPVYIGMIFAGLGIVSSVSSKKQVNTNEKFKNKTLTIIGYTMSISCIIAGLAAIMAVKYRILIIIILLAYIARYAVVGVYFSLMEKYLRNFTNNKIDTKIFMMNNFFKNSSNAILSLIASLLLSKLNIYYCMCIIGIIFTIVLTVVFKYMKKRVGLDVEKYQNKEIMYE